ncbi:hypothetical protein [Mangrovicoccus ximenensis]|uniref:hypothetical protein n=1 Tax=Mangrovicoccus ximenensis TaxID=1911570 RepID=UPI0011AE8915|nr:hypothetical protein [Mangrovicoccus ximenensis]
MRKITFSQLYEKFSDPPCTKSNYKPEAVVEILAFEKGYKSGWQDAIRSKAGEVELSPSIPSVDDVIFEFRRALRNLSILSSDFTLKVLSLIFGEIENEAILKEIKEQIEHLHGEMVLQNFDISSSSELFDMISQPSQERYEESMRDTDVAAVIRFSDEEIHFSLSDLILKMKHLYTVNLSEEKTDED